MSGYRPAVECDPWHRFGRPRIRGVSTVHIAGSVYAGESVEDTGADYGLTRADVILACWFEGWYGDRRYRRHFGAWAREADRLLCPQPRWSEIPDPPAGPRARFSEPDEPVADVVAAFDAGEKGVTAPPVEIVHMTQREWDEAQAVALAKLGMTYDELAAEARARNFRSTEAHKLWVTIGRAGAAPKSRQRES